MPTRKRQIIHKHFRLDSAKLKRAQEILAAATETEAVDGALDLAISECGRNRLARDANRRLLKSGIAIRDVLGALGEQRHPASLLLIECKERRTFSHGSNTQQ